MTPTVVAKFLAYGIWKEAIHKKNDPSDAANYMPISLLSTFGKVLENVVHKICL